MRVGSLFVLNLPRLRTRLNRRLTNHFGIVSARQSILRELLRAQEPIQEVLESDESDVIH
jgi:hypothetical protein